MVGRNKIRIHLPNRVYFGGDTIHGVVEVRIKNQVKVHGVRFFFLGREYDYAQKHPYNNVFLLYRKDFVGAPKNQRAKSEELKSGTYHYPFAITLPKFLPASYADGFNSSITYAAGAYVEVHHGFNIQARVDVRIDGNLWDSLEFAKPVPSPPQDSRRSFAFASGKLTMSATIQTMNFFVGDIARITMSVNNESKKKIEEIKVAIWNRRVTHVDHDSNDFEMRVHKQKYKKKIEHGTKSDFMLEFSIPALPPTILTKSESIASTYELEVRLDVPWSKDPRVMLPIKIMARDPKVAHLIPPPPGPLIAPIPHKYWKHLPEFQPTEMVLQNKNFPKPVNATPAHNIIDLKAEKPANPPPLKRELSKITVLEHLPINPPLYPVVEDYDYNPTSVNVVTLEFGNFELDESEHKVLAK